MTAPSVTNTFVTLTNISPGDMNTNFQDVINGMTDGTKDLEISALTCNGNVIFYANTTIGNAASDDLTITAHLASDLVPKTTNTS